MTTQAVGNGKARTAGNKANLKVSFSDLTIDIPIRYEKINSKEIQEQINIVSKAADGEVVEQKFKYVDVNDMTQDKTAEVEQIAKRSKVYAGTTNGKIYTDDEVSDYQIIKNEDGTITEEEVSAPKETTKDFEVNDTRPLDAFDNYLAESEFEVWGEDLNALKTLADYLVAHNICLMCDYQRANTHKPMKAVIKPIFEDNGTWTLVMRTTMTKYNYKHLQEQTILQQQVKTQNKVKVKLAV
jgi:hypothetical protein